MEFDKESFCENLKRLREAKGYNKYEMSIQSDIHYSYYLDIESGRSIPNFRRLISIANALNTDISHLLGEKRYSQIDIIKKEILSKLLKIQSNDFLDIILGILISIKIWDDNNERL